MLEECALSHDSAHVQSKRSWTSLINFTVSNDSANKQRRLWLDCSEKNLHPFWKGSNSFILEQTPFQKGIVSAGKQTENHPFSHVEQNTIICKQCISRWDGSSWAVSSGSTLFAILAIIKFLTVLLASNGCIQIQRRNSPLQKHGWKD